MLICCRKCKLDIDDCAEQPLKCHRCNFYYHFPSCCNTYQAFPYKLLLGDVYYKYTCDFCYNPEEDEPYQLYRQSVSWSEVAHLLRNNQLGSSLAEQQSMVEKLWHRFWANSAVNDGWKDSYTEAYNLKTIKKEAKRVLEAAILPDGSFFAMATSKTNFSAKLSRTPSVVLQKNNSSDSTLTTEQAEDGISPADAGAYGFKSAKALKKSLKKLASTFVFSNLDFDRPNPDHPVTLSKSPTHTAPQMTVDGLRVKNEAGFAMARTTHGFDSGCWYFEVKIAMQNPKGSHVRLGVSQILGECQAPVGYDEYSYAIRDRDGHVVHCGKDRPYGDCFGPGDVIGITLRLPADPILAQVDEALLSNVEKEFPPKRLGTYRVKQEVLSDPVNSSVEFSINGRNYGSAFSSIYKGKYYPAISLYMGAEAILNLGPDFDHPVPAGAKPAYLISPAE